MAAEHEMPPTVRPDTRFTLDDFMLFPDGVHRLMLDGLGLQQLRPLFT